MWSKNYCFKRDNYSLTENTFFAIPMYYLGFIFYLIAINAYQFSIWIGSLFNKRAKDFIEGRNNNIENIRILLAADSSKKIWFHVSSLGEFEQARPVMEALKVKLPLHKIIVTFFSPSGYEQMKNESIADYVFYLPFDSKKNAKELINYFNPEMVFWVKYDFWFFYLNELKNRNIKTFLLSASFRKEQIYFKGYGVFFRNILNCFTHIFTQNKVSTDLLQSIQIENVTLSKDTRYDRVYNTSQETQYLSLIEKFKAQNQLLLCGSSYPIEEKMISNFLKQNTEIKIIIAPHFVYEERIIEIENTFSGMCLRYSNADENTISSKSVLIIDSIGLLSQIYRYATIAFVGGGFVKSGLHNVLEAAAFGKPILFGPEIDKFPEALDLIKVGAAYTVANEKECKSILIELLQNKEKYLSASIAASEFIKENVGATNSVMEKIMEDYRIK